MKTPLIIDGEHASKPEGDQMCDFCDPPKYFKTWDLLAGHITIVHNDKGRTLEYYNGKIPDEILNHPDWMGVQN